MHLQEVGLRIKDIKIVRRVDGITFDVTNLDGTKTVITFMGCSIDFLAEKLNLAGAAGQDAGH